MQAAQRARTTASGLGGRILTSADHRILFKSTLLIGVLTILVKGVTLGRDILVASNFGTSDANDAFLTAWVVPSFLTVILTSGFSASIIPVQIGARTRRGDDVEQAVISEVLLIAVLSFLLLTLILIVGMQAFIPFVAQGYSESKLDLAIHLAFIMLPAVLMTGLASLWSSILNARDKFGLVAAAPITVPLIATAALVIVPGAGIEWLAATFVIGTGLQAAVLYLGVQREGLSVGVAWHGLLPETRSVLRQFGVVSANAVVFGGIGVVDTAMAATLGPGSQSTLAYANKLIIPALAVSSTALGTAVLPYFSRLVAREDWVALRHTLSTYTRLILAIAIPATIALILFSRPIVQLLYERGEFTAEDTESVSRVLATYALLIPIETIAVLLSRVLLSLQIGRVMVFASIGIFISNIIADYFLKELMGIEGIALASVMNQVLSLIFLVFMWRHLQRTRMKTT